MPPFSKENKKICPKNKDRSVICGTTLIAACIDINYTRQATHRNANTFLAFNAGIRRRYWAKTPFTLPSVVHLQTAYCGISIIARSLEAHILFDIHINGLHILQL